MLQKNTINLSVEGMEKTLNYISVNIKHNRDVEPSEYKKPLRILAISDIEGNFYSLFRLLLKNRVINRNCEWLFGEGHLVILGDCFDRGDQVMECLWLIYSLEERAKRDGGYVHFILGNHEIMNLNGDWRYTHPKYVRSSKRSPTAIYHGNDELFSWIKCKNIVEKIGDLLFVHGGISKEFNKLNLSVNDINTIARPYLTKAHQGFENPVLNEIFNTETSPIWFRGYYKQSITEKDIDTILSHFGVHSIITGHTCLDHVSSFFNGKVINIDTNHSSSNSEALLIINDNYYRVDREGKRFRVM